MTDYYEPQYSNYAPLHQPYYGDPDDENEIRRTATRGSHQSQATASTKSWVQQTQRHPPPPPPGVEDLPPQSRPASQGTAFHGPRPIPERHSGKRPVTRYVQHADDEDETFDTGDDPMVPGALRFGYQSDDLGNGRPIQAGPSTLGPSTPMLAPIAPLQIQHKKTFVGGFFKGLKKIPKIVLGRGEKGGLRRRGTFGTDGTTLTAVSHGNTLPRYLSNPSIGPSNPQFAHRLSMAVANGSLPPEATPAVFQMRTNPQPRYPEVVVTPPSAEGMPGESVHAEFYDGPPPEEEPEYHEQEPESHTDPRERTTVMVYNTDSQAPTVTQGPSSQPTRPPSAPPSVVPSGPANTGQLRSPRREHFNPPPHIVASTAIRPKLSHSLPFSSIRSTYSEPCRTTSKPASITCNDLRRRLYLNIRVDLPLRSILCIFPGPHREILQGPVPPSVDRAQSYHGRLPARRYSPCKGQDANPEQPETQTVLVSINGNGSLAAEQRRSAQQRGRRNDVASKFWVHPLAIWITSLSTVGALIRAETSPSPPPPPPFL
ncbi:hypothetical protein NLJ89_g5904 [Agrocybe chaxingu]|uniref:Uncharacterized protein n=1 Tax=Agrocybe chaxingu TaxID=84603 RepID=A0A9W8K1M9_9AGAR|nr:hypothetical protein NLJ89_g5904 [Agrocybe chaxingu]